VKSAPFAEFVANAPCILGEGAVIERLRRIEGTELDSYLVNTAFLYDDSKRAALETICRQDLEVGHDFGLPFIMSTPTWRANGWHEKI
jgi:homocysteine S-methyltransferase